MSSPFSPLKFYFTCFIVLMIIFFLSWWPCLQIDLFVSSEPLVADFETNLDILAKNIIFNLSILPAKIVNVQEAEDWPEYHFLANLEEENSEEMLIFKKADLEELIKFKIEGLNENDPFRTEETARAGKKIFKYQPEKWEIEVKEKELSAGQARLSVSVQEETIGDYDFNELKRKIKFKSIDEAKKELGKISGIRKIEMKIHPWFWQRVPLFLNRVTFQVMPAGISSTPH